MTDAKHIQTLILIWVFNLHISKFIDKHLVLSIITNIINWKSNPMVLPVEDIDNIFYLI